MILTTRVGQGYDIHRLIPGASLILGGISIPSHVQAEAHSDGDVLLHACIDAILGAMAWGDIGMHFPDHDARWKHADSCDMLSIILQKLSHAKWQIAQFDATIILEKPKLTDYRILLVEKLGALLQLESHLISIKAKTNEGLDAIGEGKAIACWCVIQLVNNI